MRHSPDIAARAELTRDMAETLITYFDEYAVKGVVTVEITEDARLWLANPGGGRQFLGLARYRGHLDG